MCTVIDKELLKINSINPCQLESKARVCIFIFILRKRERKREREGEKKMIKKGGKKIAGSFFVLYV